ncbi:hypothetical protein GUITHDRAFT_103517 [Guillardia theta CCMP2712]|uniref:Uncharacterized protein n=1 Tax=Guillardia theta (strain CCMP2712) TaxID=905079 RepID=L1JQU8_GUITC|nr:hypothetical protein GUITHDRAFT_103517 [Guillardia theta CCMP2712]EKX50936.1 hypothetical protein GUITHDRAFT_103517 [Guillardia theta CCMP2712]|eukprot:XP_005837916.1 hypothetical protein GUITHDRAFT_103517 [Guillardia theta CCMP2712]
MGQGDEFPTEYMTSSQVSWVDPKQQMSVTRKSHRGIAAEFIPTRKNISSGWRENNVTRNLWMSHGDQYSVESAALSSKEPLLDVKPVDSMRSDEEYLSTNTINSMRNLENLHENNAIFPLTPELQEELRDSGYSKNVPITTQPFDAHRKSFQPLSSTTKEDYKDPTSFRRKQHVVRPPSTSSSSYGRISTAHRFEKMKMPSLEDLHPAVASLWRARDPLYYKHTTFKVTDGFNSSKDLRTYTIEAMRASI